MTLTSVSLPHNGYFTFTKSNSGKYKVDSVYCGLFLVCVISAMAS